jgi:hypothetical protein
MQKSADVQQRDFQKVSYRITLNPSPVIPTFVRHCLFERESFFRFYSKHPELPSDSTLLNDANVTHLKSDIIRPHLSCYMYFYTVKKQLFLLHQESCFVLCLFILTNISWLALMISCCVFFSRQWRMLLPLFRSQSNLKGARA